MSEHTVVDLVGGLQGRCPPATTTDELLCVVFGGHAELQPTNTRRMKIMFIGWPPFLHIRWRTVPVFFFISTQYSPARCATWCVEKTAAIADSCEDYFMSEDRKTNVPDFLGELDAGVFVNKLSGALNNTALGVLNNGGKGKVVITLDIDRLSNSVEEKRVSIKHQLKYVTPTPRGKVSEEDTTETPMYVGKGGKLTILQEDQGQLFTVDGGTDGKLRVAK